MLFLLPFKFHRQCYSRCRFWTWVQLPTPAFWYTYAPYVRKLWKNSICWFKTYSEVLHLLILFRYLKDLSLFNNSNPKFVPVSPHLVKMYPLPYFAIKMDPFNWEPFEKAAILLYSASFWDFVFTHSHTHPHKKKHRGIKRIRTPTILLFSFPLSLF